MKPYTYRMPVPVRLETGGIHHLHQHLPRPSVRPLLVTGATSAKVSGALEALHAQFPGAPVFDQVPENPTLAVCDVGGVFCREAQCDMVIGVGGGSPLDAAKVIALLATNDGTARDYLGGRECKQPPLTSIAVPTTAGTGSEVTPYAVLVDEEANSKATLRGEGLFPAFALLDPALTRTMPRHITIATGLDALSQGMEGMLSKKATAFGNVLALEVCRLVKRWLPRAAEAPEDLEARAQMLHAAMLSGCVIAQSGTTLVHGMGYYLTLHFGVPHGLANALLLPPVFRWNAREAPRHVAALAGALGRPSPPEPKAAAENISHALRELFKQLGLSPAAREHGVAPERLPWCAEDIMKNPGRFKNQRGTLHEEDVLRIFKEAATGAGVITTAAPS